MLIVGGQLSLYLSKVVGVILQKNAGVAAH